MSARDDLIDKRAELQKQYLNACDAERSANPGEDRNEQTRLKVKLITQIRELTQQLHTTEQNATSGRRNVQSTLGAVASTSAVDRQT